LSSTLFIGIIIFIGKTWLQKFIEKSIDFKYETIIEKYRSELRKTEETLKNNFQIKLEEHKSKIQSQHSKEIENLKSNLSLRIDETKMYFLRYSEKQFEIYNNLWLSLVDLRKSISNLWDRASVENLKDLQLKYLNATEQIEKSAILIEPSHLSELQIILDEIGNFSIGKEKLIHLRFNEQLGRENNRNEINHIINDNLWTKQRFENYLVEFRLCLQRQIKGIQE